MRYGYAKKLHKGDEVTIKGTGEVVTVNEVEIYERLVVLWVESLNGYGRVCHVEIK